MSKYPGLKKNWEFTRVYRKGVSRADRNLVLYVLPGREGGGNRYGVSVSKKVGNSVVRHRIRRCVKEICRLNAAAFGEDNDLIILARKSAATADYHTLERSLLTLAARHKLADPPHKGK